MNPTLLSIATLVLAACGGAMTTTPTPMLPPDDECTRGLAEADLVATPWSGPGVQADGGLVEQNDVVVTTTFLALEPDEASAKAFREVFAEIRTDLDTREGLIAWRTSTSTRCVTARTLTVWTDEAKMFAFVNGQAHGKAVRAVVELSRGHSAVTQWRGPTSDATFETAIQKIGAAPATY
ncbi:MAG: hypothetical protein U0228_28955 [Myxococcaceae bacterium]